MATVKAKKKSFSHIQTSTICILSKDQGSSAAKKSVREEPGMSMMSSVIDVFLAVENWYITPVN